MSYGTVSNFALLCHLLLLRQLQADKRFMHANEMLYKLTSCRKDPEDRCNQIVQRVEEEEEFYMPHRQRDAIIMPI